MEKKTLTLADGRAILPLYYVNLIDELSFIERDNADVKVWIAGEAFVLRQDFRGNRSATICPLSEKCDMLSVLAEFLPDLADVGMIFVDVQGLTAATREKIMSVLKADGFSAHDKIRQEFFLPCPNPQPTDSDIRILTPADRETFMQLDYVKESYRPPLSVLFDAFVIDHTEPGDILAAYDGGKPIGYISAVRLKDNIFDVDHLYVAPAYRGKGVGTRLGAAYIGHMADLNCSALWSNPVNDASARIAEKLGFNLSRETVFYRKV